MEGDLYWRSRMAEEFSASSNPFDPGIVFAESYLMRCRRVGRIINGIENGRNLLEGIKTELKNHPQQIQTEAKAFGKYSAVVLSLYALVKCRKILG